MHTFHFLPPRLLRGFRRGRLGWFWYFQAQQVVYWYVAALDARGVYHRDRTFSHSGRRPCTVWDVVVSNNSAVVAIFYSSFRVPASMHLVLRLSLVACAIIYLFQLATSLVAVTQRFCPLPVAFSGIPPIAAIHRPITCPIASSRDSGAAVPVLTARCSYYLQERLASSTRRSHSKNVGSFAPNSRPWYPNLSLFQRPRIPLRCSFFGWRNR